MILIFHTSKVYAFSFDQTLLSNIEKDWDTEILPFFTQIYISHDEMKTYLNQLNSEYPFIVSKYLTNEDKTTGQREIVEIEMTFSKSFPCLRNNYQYKFGIDDLGSNGDSECEERFRGPTSFTEIETIAIKQSIEELISGNMNLSAVLNLESHSTVNGLIKPNNYIREHNNLLLMNQDVRTFKFFEDMKNYADKATGKFIDVGNTIDLLDMPNNGDPDDYIFQQKKILSMTIFMAPYNFTNNNQAGSYFLNDEETQQVILRNKDLITYLLRKSTQFVKLQLELPYLCQILKNNQLNLEYCPYSSDFYDLYIVQEIDISNIGRVDASGNINLEIHNGDLMLIKLFMRSSRALQYEEVPFLKSRATDSITIQLPSIERDQLRNIGIICIFHYEIKNITSIQDVRETVVYNQLINFVVNYENGIAKEEKAASINLQLLYTYLNTQIIEDSLNANQFKASKGILYAFYAVAIIFAIIWVLQITLNIFRINKQREQEKIKSAFDGEIELKILDNHKDSVEDKAGDDQYEEYDFKLKTQILDNQAQHSREIKIDYDQFYNPHQHLNSDASMMNQSKNISQIGLKKPQHLNIELPQLSNYDSSQSSGRYLESTRSLLVSQKQERLGYQYQSNDFESNKISSNKNQVIEDPNLVNQPHFINLKKQQKQKKTQVDADDRNANVEKIPKQQFKVDYAKSKSKGKIKVIKETDNTIPQRTLKKIGSQIKEEENETSWFQADQSNITMGQNQIEDPTDRMEIEYQVHSITNSEKKGEIVENNKKSNMMGAQQQLQWDEIIYDEQISQNNQSQMYIDQQIKDMKDTQNIQNRHISNNDVRQYARFQNDPIQQNQDQRQKDENSFGGQSDQRSQQQKKNKRAQPNFNNFMGSENSQIDQNVDDAHAYDI